MQSSEANYTSAETLKRNGTISSSSGGHAAVLRWGRYLLFGQPDLERVERIFKRYGEVAFFLRTAGTRHVELSLLMGPRLSNAQKLATSYTRAFGSDP
ncbi:MAG: hypothetical protein KGO02_21815 [Alphaproteobacteria bacterium]|nr:hypothetical protein [Alphaproteobacteria bacterium]